MDSAPPDLLALCRDSLDRAATAGTVDERLRSLQAALRLARAACRIARDHAASSAEDLHSSKL